MNRENLQRQITLHHRRLQKLKERQALAGIGTDPAILLEMEDIEAAIASLLASKKRA